MRTGVRLHWPSALVFGAAVTFIIVILLRVIMSGDLVASLIALGLLMLLVGLLVHVSLKP